VPFLETQVLIGSRGGRSSPVKLRALPADSLREDGGFANALGLGAAALSGGEAVVIGAELARYLDVAPGDEITLLAILSGGEEGVETRSLVRKVSAVFRSGFYDYDFGLGFMNVEGASAIFPPDTERPWVYGVKLQDRDGDAAFLGRLSREGIPGAEGWREYNRSFFGALRTETTMMLLLAGLIFLVVGVNIYQAMRRNVFERMEDMALVKALGGRGEELRRIFILDGFAIGFFGAAIGLVLGLLVATNVNEIFAAAAFAMNGLSALIAGLSGSLPSDYSVFSPAYFYISEVPVRLLFPELFFIVLAALASSTAAAAVASSRIASLNPAELLRYE
jgi:lipoprotein-releasing system permease protein